MTQREDQVIERFLTDLEREEASVQTIPRLLLRSEPFWPLVLRQRARISPHRRSLPPTFAIYKAHLQTGERRSPATINRHLAALRRFFGWAKARGLIAEQHQHQFLFEPKAPSLVATVDETRLHRVLANLLSNAIKYSRKSDRSASA